jgi:mannose-6-phosphate isomerase-like protein (cupin superfamily)
MQPCTTIEGGWAKGPGHQEQPVKVEGHSLKVELRRWRKGEVAKGTPCGSNGEEMAAVMAGSFRVRAGDEEHVLSPGEGIIIPPGTKRDWKALESNGTLYRVVNANPPPKG